MKYAYAAILAITILLVSACNGSDAAPEQTTDHVLTILARNTYEGPIRQAEQALIAEWTQRPDKAGHTFSIELTTFHPDDEMNHLTRLDTMLMAGQAYDIFFPVADHRHLREYALSGFLTDFYPLIENCQHSNLDDFFANALEAWDIDGSLYVFPWDFCFSFAFMNAALPPHLIERFNAHSTITVTELTDMYRELLFYHGYHFGHFAFSHGSTLHHPSRILASSLGDFVGFENGTANITDDAFISFLTTFSAVFDERHFHQQGQPYWQNWWTRCPTMTSYRPSFHYATLHMIARGRNDFTWRASRLWDNLLAVTMPPHAFMVESRHQFSVAAMLCENVYAPYFEPGIPLMDEDGNLLIANDSAYPSGIAISAAANGAVAWDFSRHLVDAFNRREVHSFYSLFYTYSMAIPMVREIFDFRMRSSLAAAYLRFVAHEMIITPIPLSANIYEWTDYIVTLALPYITALAEMPMALTRPPIPEHLYADNLELLLRGLITPQDFAQRTQNAVSLWLIGG